MLAAINLVESAFGRVRSPSGAGAQGPMQFLPDTWRRYGLGGDVHDPHDAILGAANYLHANGAPTRTWTRSGTTTRRGSTSTPCCATPGGCARDRRASTRFYAWQVFVRTPQGDVRLTGPGLG